MGGWQVGRRQPKLRGNEVSRLGLLKTVLDEVILYEPLHLFQKRHAHLGALVTG
jgi:hypothetical protein